MNRNQFIQKNAVQNFHYFEKDNTNPSQLSLLDNTELSYLNEDNLIYKDKSMDNEGVIHTYIFSDEALHLHITHTLSSHIKIMEFYRDGLVSTKITYFNNEKIKMESFDPFGKMMLSINYPNDNLNQQFEGFRYYHPTQRKSNILQKLNMESEDPNLSYQTELGLWELQQYL